MSDIRQYDEVICIDDTLGPGSVNGLYDYPEEFLQKGVVYSVEEVVDWVYVKDYKAERQTALHVYRKHCYRKNDTERKTRIPFSASRFALLDGYEGEIVGVH